MLVKEEVDVRSVARLQDEASSMIGYKDMHSSRKRLEDAYLALVSLCDKENFVYRVLIKFIADRASSELENQGQVIPSMDKDHVQQHVMYYSGRWQVLKELAHDLSQDQINKQLDNLRSTADK